jgi:exonuclease III
MRLVTVYRPPYSDTHPVTVGTFFAEFSTYLESIVLSTQPLMIIGDINIHVDNRKDSDAAAFLDLLESINFEQHVNKATHECGHTLDLVITHQTDSYYQANLKLGDSFLTMPLSIVC